MIQRACVLAGVIALFLQGSSGGHMLLVEHTRCAEHGELVHEGEAHLHQSASHAETGAAGLLGASNEPSEEAHGHCAPQGNRHNALTSVATARVSAPLIEVPQPQLSAGAPIPPQNQPFRVAPKNSPPA